jgi:hypothetical protein
VSPICITTTTLLIPRCSLAIIINASMIYCEYRLVWDLPFLGHSTHYMPVS